MGLRETKKNRTRSDILTAARELFLKRGFEATRVRDIAQRLELSDQTVFNYFPSKQAIVDAMAQEWISESVTAAASAKIAEGDSPTDRARKNLGQYLIHLSAHRNFVRLMLDHSSLAAPQGADREEAVTRRRPLLEQLKSNLRFSTESWRTAQQRGEINQDVDAAELAELIQLIISWSLRTWVDTEPEVSLVEMVFRRIRLVLDGVRDSPPPDLQTVLRDLKGSGRPS